MPTTDYRARTLGLGWDFGREIDRGMIQIVFIPQPNIMVEEHLRVRLDLSGRDQAAFALG
jgi:hypothetical protein